MQREAHVHIPCFYSPPSFMIHTQTQARFRCRPQLNLPLPPLCNLSSKVRLEPPGSTRPRADLRLICSWVRLNSNRTRSVFIPRRDAWRWMVSGYEKTRASLFPGLESGSFFSSKLWWASWIGASALYIGQRGDPTADVALYRRSLMGSAAIHESWLSRLSRGGARRLLRESFKTKAWRDGSRLIRFRFGHGLNPTLLHTHLSYNWIHGSHVRSWIQICDRDPLDSFGENYEFMNSLFHLSK